MPSEVNYSDRGHDSTMLTVTHLSACSIVCTFCSGNPCHHILVSRHRPFVLSADHHVITFQHVSPILSTKAVQQKHKALVRHQPLCQLSVIRLMPQQRVFLVWMKGLCHRLITTPCPGRVFLVGKVLELWPILFRECWCLRSVQLLRLRRQ